MPRYGSNIVMNAFQAWACSERAGSRSAESWVDIMSGLLQLECVHAKCLFTSLLPATDAPLCGELSQSFGLLCTGIVGCKQSLTQHSSPQTSSEAQNCQPLQIEKANLFSLSTTREDQEEPVQCSLPTLRRQVYYHNWFAGTGLNKYCP